MKQNIYIEHINNKGEKMALIYQTLDVSPNTKQKNRVVWSHDEHTKGELQPFKNIDKIVGDVHKLEPTEVDLIKGFVDAGFKITQQL